MHRDDADHGALAGDVIGPNNPPDAKDAYSLLVEMATEYAMYTLSPEGLVSTWTLGAERIKGYRAEEIIGRHFSVFYRQDERDAGVPERALELARSTNRAEMAGWRIRKDGSEFWASVLIVPLRDGNGRVRGYAKLTRDETERHAAEARRREVDFVSAQEKIASSLAGTVVHELFSVGMQLMSTVQMVSDPAVRQRLERTSARIDRLIKDMRRTAFDMSVLNREREQTS